MCVIVVSENGSKVSKKDFKEMWARNSHGWGIAWLDPQDGMINVKKGIMTLKEAENFYYQEVPEGVSHIMHFRLTSAGTTCQELTHPFRVDLIDTQELEYKACAVLFHNGTVSGYKAFLPAILTKLEPTEVEKLLNMKDVSDTYLMSIMVRLFSHKILKFYTSSRWAVFTIESGSPQIFLYGDFQKYKEFHVSNLSWQAPQYTYTYTYTSSLGKNKKKNNSLLGYCPSFDEEDLRERYVETLEEDEDEDEFYYWNKYYSY